MSDEREKVDAAQFESGLAPLLAKWEDANVQRVYSILNDELEHKSDEEHWEGYCARWIVGELIDPLNAEIERLEGLLREIAAIPNSLSGDDWDEIEKARAIANSAFEAAVTGE